MLWHSHSNGTIVETKSSIKGIAMCRNAQQALHTQTKPSCALLEGAASGQRIGAAPRTELVEDKLHRACEVLLAAVIRA